MSIKKEKLGESMKVIIVSKELEFCISVDRKRQETIMYNCLKNLLNMECKNRITDITDTIEIGNDNSENFHCFKKPFYSSYFRNCKTENLHFVGIPGFFDKNVSEHINNENNSRVLECFNNNNSTPIMDIFEGFELGIDYFTENAMRRVFNQKYWDSVYEPIKTEEGYQEYLKFNKMVAKQILDVYNEGDEVLILDYEYWLLPELLKEANPNIIVAVSFLEQFPDVDIMKKLSHSKVLMTSLLKANILEFQNKKNLDNFQTSAFIFCNKEYKCDEINAEKIDETHKRLGNIIDHKVLKTENQLFCINKIGTDIDSVKKILNEDFTKKTIESIKNTYKEKQLIVIVSTYDNMFLLKDTLMAIYKYLENKDKDIAILKIEINTGSVDQEIYSEVLKLQEVIKLKFSNTVIETIVPVNDFLYYALLSIADLGIVLSESSCSFKPLFDFIISQEDKKSPLILSEFDPMVENIGFVTVNTQKIDDFVELIGEMLETPKDDEYYKLLHSWATRKTIDDFLEQHFIAYRDLLYEENKMKEDFTLKPRVNEENLLERIKSVKKVLFVLDYDGTLKEIVTKPEDAKPTAEILNIIKNLSEKYDIIISTGRDKKTIDEWFPDKNITVHAGHGVLERKNGEWMLAKKEMDFSWYDDAKRILDYHNKRIPGSRLEDKEVGVAFHYRNVDPKIKDVSVKECKEDLIRGLKNRGCEIQEGKEVIDIKTAGFNKGTLIQSYLDDYDLIIGIGDDKTDEHMFKVLTSPNSISIKVENKPTLASFYIESPAEVRVLLKKISEY
ncbi:Trehalose-6-phosphate phosphatase [Spraguea lophii 42_110]|uniref:Trehalose-6-phosphate phosphatase n=1 Tax=Spraguea lophii (strain 42_110) TaxID=1358809 RepID=S7WCC2_SPRLO|nr:Trehalose-6-phosphate phosphatase [Spraguea lophii 42_110]